MIEKNLNAQAYPPIVTNKERELKTQSDLILVILVLAEHPRKYSLKDNGVFNQRKLGKEVNPSEVLTGKY